MLFDPLSKYDPSEAAESCVLYEAILENALQRQFHNRSETPHPNWDVQLLIGSAAMKQSHVVRAAQLDLHQHYGLLSSAKRPG